MHPDQQRWNQRYKKQGLESFGDQASEWLFEHEELLKIHPKGLALDIACGNGRNAFYLANLGYEVDAVDISDVAIEGVREKAMQSNLSVHPFHLNLEEQPFPQNSYQLIICFNYLQRSLFPNILHSLSEGGILIYETKYLDHIHVLKHEMNPAYVLGYNELLHSFSDLHILHYQEHIKKVGPSQRQKALASLVGINSRIPD